MAQMIALPSGEMVEFPDDTPLDVMENALAEYVKANPSAGKAPGPARDDRSGGEVLANSAGLAARGFNDVLADVAGAPVDLVGRGMRSVGVPVAEDAFGGSESIRRGMRALTDVAGAPTAPQTTAERLAYGAGRGLGETAALAIPGAVAARTARAGSLAAGVGESLAAAPVLQGTAGATAGAVSEATDNPWLGAAAGMAVPLAAGAGRRIISPVRNTLNAEQQRLADVARQEGLELTPGQQTGSRTLLGMDSVFADLPLTNGTRRAEMQAQQQAYNRAILRRAGVDAETASPDVLTAARADLGNEFATLSARNSIDANLPGLANDLATLDNNLVDASNDVAGRVRGLADELLNNVDGNGRISGEFYQNFQSRLSRIMRENGNNPELRNRIRDLRDATRGAMDRSITPEDAEAWREVTRRYANLKVIENAVNNGSTASAQGDLTGSALAGAIKQSTGNGFAMGRGDLNDLARVGSRFVRDPINNSGTAQRSMLMNLLQGRLAQGAGLSAGAAGMMADPLLTSATAAGALLLPKAIQTAANTRAARRYLTNQLAQNYRARRSVPGILAADAMRLRERKDD